jgi:hypothetical protein
MSGPHFELFKEYWFPFTFVDECTSFNMCFYSTGVQTHSTMTSHFSTSVFLLDKIYRALPLRSGHSPNSTANNDHQLRTLQNSRKEKQVPVEKYVLELIWVPDLCSFRILDCSTNVSGTQQPPSLYKILVKPQYILTNVLEPKISKKNMSKYCFF